MTKETTLNAKRSLHDARPQLARMALLALLAVMAGACAQVGPRISHAHLGHALTAWHDTPERKGLLVVARNLADTALREADAATRAGSEAARLHVANVVAALSPETVARPRPDGYGVVRALEGAIDHLEYAAASNDASSNLVVATAEITAVSEAVTDGFRRALALARAAEQQPPERLGEAASKLRRALEQSIRGNDADGDGRVALSEREAGLAQIEQRLARAVAAERDPPYRPLPQTLLFGMIRLPDGQWRFKDAAVPSPTSHQSVSPPPGSRPSLGY